MTPRDPAHDEQIIAAATEGPWAYLSSDEKGNAWQVGQWERPDGTPVVDEVNDDDMERYVAEGEPEDFAHAICTDTVCEAPSSSANFQDAVFVAEARTAWPYWMARALAAEARCEEAEAFAKEGWAWLDEALAALGIKTVFEIPDSLLASTTEGETGE